MGTRRIAGDPNSPPKTSERTVVGSRVPAAASGREVEKGDTSTASDMLNKANDDDDDDVAADD